MSKLLQLLKETFHQRSSASAVSFGDKTWTYLDLDQHAEIIAQNLTQNHSVKANDLVAIACAKSLEQMALLLALVKIGATYLPIDLDLPEQRAQYMLSHSNAKLVITELLLKKLLAPPLHIVTLSAPTEHNFYLLYTSGSTGAPKGVLMGSQALHHLLDWQIQETELKEQSITLQFSPLGFDVHFQEIFATLASGGHLVLVSENDRKNMTKLITAINEHGINRLYLPFVAFNLLAEVALRTNKSLNSLREITVAGEQLKITPHIRNFITAHSQVILFNHYGPTETHVVTSLKLNPKELPALQWPELPSIGYATGTNKIHIVDSDMNEVAEGTTGEILISGLALAEGYHFNDDENLKRFFKHPELGRVYRTNDLAKKLPSGEIEFLGRNDRQMKIRGHRVELSEIESQILKVSKALTCAVIPYQVNESTYLKAIVSGTSLNPAEIKHALKNVIPDFMIPDLFEIQEQMPLTSSGKIDYQKLTSEIAKASPLQEQITAIWKKHLPVSEFDMATSFFDLGGHSLSLAQMLLDINETLNLNLDLVDVFENNTIEKLISLCDVSRNSSAETKSNVKPAVNINEKIAIIASHGHFPESSDVQIFWKNLLAQKNLVRSFTQDSVHPLTSVSDNHVFASGEYPDGDTFDFEHFGMSLLEAQLMDPQQRKFLELCFEALHLAGYPAAKNNSMHKNTGVFASMSSSRYADLIREYPDKVNALGAFATSLGIEKDYLATRVAHKLNLSGPALNINTACSSSLVAVIQAVESLRARTCDMALAGGIAIANLDYEGHIHNAGSIYSENNECRVFDNKATGTIFTHGSGVVVLKRLSDATRDQDNILGLISGVGLSNDGADKMSFTGPSIEGQVQAISKAHSDAQISPEQILFIEAHGTGTPIGDPAEVTALTRAFEKQTLAKEFCYLSSVKANAGHLNAASGVAGLIKATQALRTKILPGQIHIHQINPLLKLSDSPFRISLTNTILNSTPECRYAGVSSFGVGGTNAHLILESYEAQINDDRQVTLVFPGFGSQYSKMGQQLLARHSDVLALDLRDLNAALTKLKKPSAEAILHSSDTALSTLQLQIFIYQYLLAKLVITKFNLKNISLLGCSLGEISAACVAGLISIEDTINFLTTRAETLADAPVGAMLLVSANKNDYVTVLSNYKVEIGIVYSEDLFVVTGPRANILKFQSALDHQNTHCLLIESRYAYHSSLLQASTARLDSMAADLTLNSSRFNFIKTSDSVFNMTDLAYWQTHHVHKVDIDQAIRSLLKTEDNRLFIEIGPQAFLNQQIKKTVAKLNSRASFINISSSTLASEVATLTLGLNEIAQYFENKRLSLKTSHLPKVTLKKTKVVLPPLQRKNEPLMQSSNTDSFDSLIQQLTAMINNDLGYTTDSNVADVQRTHFLELGLDSLMLTQMSSLVKAKFKTNVSFRELKEKFNTLESLAQHILATHPPAVQVKAATVTTSTQNAIKPTVASNSLENIIQMQLQLMQEQINLLKGKTTATVTAKATTPAPVVTSAEKSFGAQAKINLHSVYNYDERVKQNIKNFERKYTHKTQGSKDFAARSRKVHADPRSVSGFRPETKEITYPIVVQKSDGQNLWDVNGNSYIDMLCGFGSNFYGNKNPHILNAMLEQLKAGIEVGPQHPLSLDAAQLVVELTGNERAAFCNTGSEAVLGAMRIARTVTAKKKIVSFAGSYHGINDDVIVRAGANGQTIPAASGICSESVSNTIVLEYGAQSSLDYIRAHADDIAGVLVEPVQSRRCNFQPQEFLTELRKVTLELEICLIFDEIITGFRIQAAGAQGYFNIQADLCTYGKIIGGGLPIGIVAGRAKYMNALDGGLWNFGDDSYPQDGVTYFAGTFVRHPLALAACKASLEIIKANPKDLYQDLNQKSANFANELNEYFAGENFPLTFDRFGSLMKPRWTQTPLASEIFFALIRYHGVHAYDGFPWFVNLAHTEAQLQEVISAIKKAIIDMKALGLFTSGSELFVSKKAISNIDFIETATERTFIGKNKNGFPATFIEDKNNPGTYIQIIPVGDNK
ncbi:MAG: aminotransferase class III-fold pyridoxal phosphate-dependent enzyme [Bdellovibrionota bacterium]